MKLRKLSRVICLYEKIGGNKLVEAIKGHQCVRMAMLVKKEDCKAEFNVEDMNFWKKWYFRK